MSIADKKAKLEKQKENLKNPKLKEYWDLFEKARDLYYKEIKDKDLSEYDIVNINSKLRRMSEMIGDSPWKLANGPYGYFIVGHNNSPVTAKGDVYWSPYADGMFRQLSSKNTEKANAKLDRLLSAWARNHGVAVESLKSVMEKFPNRFEENALGVSDFMNSLIALADNKNIDTFAEEVAHFAIEMLVLSEGDSLNFMGPPNMKNALEQVTSTATYAEVKAEYKDIYEREDDFRKEALGKILAAEIVNQFKQTDQFVAEEVSGFWQSLQAAWADFTNWVNSNLGINTAGRTDIEQIIIPLAQDILNLEQIGDYGKFENYTSIRQYEGKGKFTQEDTKFQLEKKETKKKLNKKEEFLKQAREQLLKKLAKVKLLQEDSRDKKSAKGRAELELQRDELERNIANEEWSRTSMRIIL